MSYVREMEAELLGQRRARLMTIAGTSALIAVVVAVPTIPVQFSGYAKTHPDSAFTLASASLGVTGAALFASIVAIRRSRELEGAVRLLAPGPAPPDLGAILRAWSPDMFLLASSSGAGGAVCGLAVAVAFLVGERHAAWSILAILGLALLVLAAATECTVRRSVKWRGPLDQLANGASSIRDGRADEALVGEEPTLRRLEEGDVLEVRVDRNLPAPEYVARHVFGERAYSEEASASDGWQRFRRVDPAVAGSEDATAFVPSLQPILKRLGPVVAAMLLTLTMLVTTLSVLHGAPSRLPGWTLGSPLVYEAARAALIVLGTAVLSNLLLALASGRLVSKMGPQGGLELDAAALVSESGGSDRATAAALLTLNQRIDTLERTHEGAVRSMGGAIAHANERLQVLTEALAESAVLRRPAGDADDR